MVPPAGFLLAPIHEGGPGVPLRISVLVRENADSAAGAFALLREVPGSAAYLGALADVQGRVHEWLEILVQTGDFRDVAFSGYQEKLTNHTFDQRWQADFQNRLAQFPQQVLVTGMEETSPAPLMVYKPSTPGSAFAPVAPLGWQLCKDDALLEAHGLTPYTTSPYRYLVRSGDQEAKTFLATSPEAPANAHVQTLDRALADSGAWQVFNPHAGRILVTRFSPLALEDYLQILEGSAWQEFEPGLGGQVPQGIYAALQAWSSAPKGMPFLLHGPSHAPERLNEIFFLKVSIFLNLLKEVRRQVQVHQLPLLNLAPSSFRLQLPDTGEQFPALWSARASLVRPGQAYPLRIKSTEQRYFVRLGGVEPSPYLPEGLGAHSFGIGSVRLRNVIADTDGTVLEGTLVAEDYLGLDPHDLLWFKLPLGEVRLEFYAHVYTSEAVGPREARFRTVPARLPDTAVATLKRSTTFAKSPYEIWPLLSSPCDLHSLGIIGLRMFLANSKTTLAVTIDDALGLARLLGKEQEEEDKLLLRLKGVLEKDRHAVELLSPCRLIDTDLNPQQAWAQIHKALWIQTLGVLLRMFPGTGSHAYCKSFGDVSPLALETIFDAPIEELEVLCLRLRSVLLPGLSENEEVAAAILEQLKALE
jgi:hypothetical protein